MIHLFCGYEKREGIGFHVFMHGVMRHASEPVAIMPLGTCGQRAGSNAFTLSRFLVPHLMGYKGHAIFADASDMVCNADIAELDALFDDRFAVQVVKHDYKTQHPRKYIGTSMECDNLDYERKNWASLMLVNCEHPDWRVSPDDVKQVPMLSLLQFHFLRDADIGELPQQWNVLADEGQSLDDGKILHYTTGIPAFDAYSDGPGAPSWFYNYSDMMRFG